MKFQLQLCIIVLTCLLSHAHGQEAKNPAETRPEFKIEVFEESFRELIDPSQKIEVLAEGFRWSEGPVWHKTKKVLLVFGCAREQDLPTGGRRTERVHGSQRF